MTQAEADAITLEIGQLRTAINRWLVGIDKNQSLNRLAAIETSLRAVFPVPVPPPPQDHMNPPPFRRVRLLWQAWIQPGRHGW